MAISLHSARACHGSQVNYVIQGSEASRSKLERGEITGQDDPKIVWESEPAFQLHKLNKFRACYNNLRKELEDRGKSPPAMNVSLLLAQYSNI